MLNNWFENDLACRGEDKYDLTKTEKGLICHDETGVALMEVQSITQSRFLLRKLP